VSTKWEEIGPKLTELFEYSDGQLVRKTGRYKGNVAGWMGKNGYLYVSIGPKDKFLAHRIIWYILKGPIDSKDRIDHINRDTSDNRIENLRLCTHQQNMCNLQMSPEHKASTGIKGVHANNGSYMGRTYHKGKCYTKTFKDIHKAEAWVRAKREKLHGEYCNHG